MYISQTMIKISLKQHLIPFRKFRDESIRQTLNGFIYEYYCYDKILESKPNIHIILSKGIPAKYGNGFAIKNDSGLYYTQHKITLGEFDILGLDDEGTLFWWEVTTSAKESKIRQMINKKKELLSKLFNRISFSIIVPEERPFLNDIQTTIIPAPKFEDYYKDYYEIKSDTSNCWSLQKLNEVAKPYDYIEDIMTTSKKFFSKEVSSFHSFLIERLYNLNDFQNKQISYFNTKKQIYGDLIYENNKIYKQEIFGEQFPIPPNKAIHFEVRQIKKRLGIAL